MTMSIAAVKKDLVSGKKNATDIAKHSLAQAKKLNETYNSFIHFCDDLALASAGRIDEKIKSGKPLGMLAGVSVGIKDNIVVKGYPATAGSAILKDYKASFDADVVRFLMEEDAIIIGKTNMDEFAMGSSSETSFAGPVKNHIDPSLVPGGSSGGSAVAVGSGQVMVALGSDTGGSIRQPASFTGTIGLKPTYGRVSRFGLIAMASSLDQIGTFTTSLEDAATLLSVISRPTAFDSTYGAKELLPDIPTDEEAIEMVRGLRIGVPKQFFGKGLESSIHEAINTALETLTKKGAKLQWLDMPLLEQALACYYIIMPAEASSNLGRYDGIRYGTRGTKEGAASLEELYGKTRAHGFGQEVRRRIILGTYVLSAGYIDKYYLQAQKVRAALLEEFTQSFASCDLLAGPTSPVSPFKLGEKMDDPVSMYLSDIYTVGANLAGLPAISLPLSGLALPAGLQLIAPHFQEGKLLALSKGISALIT